ncbi:hypothetical protein E2C01_087728 [Portunus trituberculatus]|uniref:Uncharacterized protein n=1 Tax=Portunus trituberculatus TaxID=210409 RepID=A0A5B7JI26_PORTR|nr:hypothetical protein [Portunus trituberculatus]
MSTRIKRQLSKSGSGGGGEGAAAGGVAAAPVSAAAAAAATTAAAARRKRRVDNSGSDDEERSVWTPKHLGDLRAYNRSASEAPAEVGNTCLHWGNLGGSVWFGWNSLGLDVVGFSFIVLDLVEFCFIVFGEVRLGCVWC